MECAVGGRAAGDGGNERAEGGQPVTGSELLESGRLVTRRYRSASGSPDTGAANLWRTVTCGHTLHCSSEYQVASLQLGDFFNVFFALEVWKASSLHVALIQSLQLQRLLVLDFVVDRVELTMWFNMHSTKIGEG